MIVTRQLSEPEFKAGFVEPMENITATAAPAMDIWPHVDALDLDEVGVPSLNDVHYVYRDARNWFDQVLIGTGRFNALLAVVVDLKSSTIHGHFLLDLNEEHDTTGGRLSLISQASGEEAWRLPSRPR